MYSLHAYGQGNFKPEGEFHGFGGGADVAWTVGLVLSPELSMSWDWTLYVDLFTFFTAMFTRSLELGSDLEPLLEFLFLRWYRHTGFGV